MKSIIGNFKPYNFEEIKKYVSVRTKKGTWPEVGKKLKRSGDSIGHRWLGHIGPTLFAFSGVL